MNRTAQGWEVRLREKWTEPRYWQNDKFNADVQPVVEISWYESVAFCLWLSEETGEKIMLPTEEQWQYAAQGDDGRDYPWGNEWNGSRCRSSVGGELGSAENTVDVTFYEGKGDSALGLVDMAGNVWEWCLTDPNNGTNDVNSNSYSRILKGGSWYFHKLQDFQCLGRYEGNPRMGYPDAGFRISRLNEA